MKNGSSTRRHIVVRTKQQNGGYAATEERKQTDFRQFFQRDSERAVLYKCKNRKAGKRKK